MNLMMEEYLQDEHRREIVREITGHRLQEQAYRSMVHRPNWFTRAMTRLGQWLIARGERLVKQYEVPANCAAPSEPGFAH